MADLSSAFKGRGPGEHANVEQPHNELDADIFNDIEAALALVNADAESLLAFIRALDFAIQFSPDKYEAVAGVSKPVGLFVTLAGGKRNPFSLVSAVSVQILSDTTGGALIDGAAGPVLVSFTNGEGVVDVLAPGAGIVKLGLIDSEGTGLDISDQASVYVDQPVPPLPDDSLVVNLDGNLIRVLQDLDESGLGLIEVLHEGVVIGQRRKLNFKGTGIDLVQLSNGEVEVRIEAVGGAIVDEPYNCDAAVNVRDLVCITAVDYVEKADASGSIKMPGIGFVSSKLNPTTCYVRSIGKITGFAGLQTGKTYFADPAVPGGITHVGPVGNSGKVRQEVGFAKNGSTLMIVIDRDWIVL